MEELSFAGKTFIWNRPASSIEAGVDPDSYPPHSTSILSRAKGSCSFTLLELQSTSSLSHIPDIPQDPST